MAAKFKFLILYYLSWVLFFDFLRLLFLVYHSSKTKELPFSTTVATFWYGLRMDLSMAAYILLPVVLFVLVSLVVPFFRNTLIYKIYTGIVLFFVLLVSICDLEIYDAWGFRIDATPLMFLSSPREAIASVSHLPLIFILLGFALAFTLIWFAFRFVLKKIFFSLQQRMKIITAVSLLAFMALLIIPVQGWISTGST